MTLKEIVQEIHKPALKKFEKRKVKVFGINQIWAVDLVEMIPYADINDGYKYFLNVIDCFTRYAYVEPLKNKSAIEVLNALKKIVAKSKSKPKKIWADSGKEFINKDMKKWMDENDISIYHTYSENKSVMIERFNRTLKNKMWMKFDENGNFRWIDILQDLISDYNNTIHRSIKMTPKEANNKKIEPILSEVLNIDNRKQIKPKFKVGDKVRISKVKGIFEKGYLPNWSYEVFTVDEVKNTNPPTYLLKDWQDEKIEGSFYDQELQKTKLGNIYIVEDIIKKRKNKGKNEVYVKWRGFSDKHNSWILESELKD